MRSWRAWVAGALLGLAGCGGSDDGQPEAGAPAAGPDPSAQEAAAVPTGMGPDVVPLTPAQHLTRASMALRGVRPTDAELRAVEENPARVTALVDYYLTTPEFGVTVRELHEEALLIGVDPAIYPAGFVPRGPLAELDSQTLNRSLIEAPLRLIEDVVMADRPYSEIVSADYALANRVTATVWGMRFEDGTNPEAVATDSWKRAQYEDGRPMAGILSDSFLFTRHSSTVSNKGRGRANVIARALLCYDFLSREIPLDSSIDLADPAAVSNAVRDNPACVSCHQTLDPLAGYFSSYRPLYVPTQQTTYPIRFVGPLYEALLKVSEPSYFGLVGGDLAVLGEMISQDPRFSECAARRFYGYLGQTDPEAVPAALASELQGALIDSGMSARALAKAVVMSDAFRSSHVDPAADGPSTDPDRLIGLMKARPRQLARSIEALTGYRWRTRLPVDIGTGTIGEVDLMDDALFGFKVLAGGIDSQHVTRPSHTATATSTLTLDNLAERAAAHVVAKDYLIDDPSRRWLLTEVAHDTTDEAQVRAQLVRLSRLLYGEPADPNDAATDGTYGLFQSVLDASDGDLERAWTVTVYAMFRDPRFVYF